MNYTHTHVIVHCDSDAPICWRTMAESEATRLDYYYL